jgi:hypothetical protein
MDMKRIESSGPAGAGFLFATCMALGCASPGAPDKPVELVTSQYQFACRAWTPSAPPVTRTLIDVRLAQIDTAQRPAADLVRAVVAAGGRIVYEFHGPMVRAELDVAAVPSLAALNSAITVVQPDSHDVSLIVMLSHNLTDADLQAVEALGGRVIRRFDSIDGYSVVIDDAKVPAVRGLPGVTLAGFDAMGCID